jgi:hypothetical protein
LIGQPLDKRRVDDWKKKLTLRQIEIIESVTKDILPQLGYEPMFGLTAKKVNTLEFVGTHFQEAYRRAINKLQRRLRYRRLSIVPPSAKSA